MSEKNGYVSRVVQLDALALDAEFYNLVKNQVGDLFSRFNVRRFSRSIIYNL